MSLEENIKVIVEQVLAQLNNSEASMASVQDSSGASSCSLQDRSEVAKCPLQAGEVSLNPDATEELPDLTQVALQEYLQVPNPNNKDHYEQLKKSTPARIGVWRAGTRPLTDTLLRFRADHAAAQDAVLSEISEDFLARFDLLRLQSACRDKDEYLTRPDLGRILNQESMENLRASAKTGADVQIIISDGLSSTAVEQNIPDLLPALEQGLKSMNLSTGTLLFVKYGRVAIMDVIGEVLKPKVAVILIGERPGLGNAESLSAYLAYNPRQGMLENERTVISNIHRKGTPAPEAGAYLASLIAKVLAAKASGVNFKGA